jgi:hypothetical protein
MNSFVLTPHLFVQLKCRDGCLNYKKLGKIVRFILVIDSMTLLAHISHNRRFVELVHSLQCMAIFSSLDI